MITRSVLQVLVVEQDVYARHAITSYLGWDRRTRVVGLIGSLDEMPAFLSRDHAASALDLVLLETPASCSLGALQETLSQLGRALPRARVVCLAYRPDPEQALACARGGAVGYLVRGCVGPALASAVCAAHDHPFVVTHDVAPLLSGRLAGWPGRVHVLPDLKDHHLSGRVEQALDLVVLDGMPADVAADEMGVSTSTVRSYVKEGYRILEEDDPTIYPPQISPVERAFVRISALDEDGSENGGDRRAV